MDKRTKKLLNIRKEEEAVTAMFTHKLHALFQTRYREYKKDNGKNKNRGGDLKMPSSARRIKKVSEKSLEALKQEIKLFIAFYGIGTPHYRQKDLPGLSREQTLLINIDFEGLYFTPAEEDFSTEYKTVKNTAATYDIIRPYKTSDYDLNQIPIWKEMKKFNSFRHMYSPICRQLVQIGYPPENLNSLNLADVLSLINHHNRENPKQRMSNQRTRFLKMFAACYGQEFSEKMTILGKEKLAKDFLTYISCLDSDKKCPQECRYAAEIFNVHHTKNRKYADELDDYSKVNDFSNLALCFSFPHHKALHTPAEIDLNPNIVFLGGFLREFQIIRNPEKERLYQMGMLKTTKQRTNR